MSNSDLRHRAWRVLRRVEQGARLGTVLDAALAELASDRDRRQLAELVKGTLRLQGRYDALLTRLTRPGLRVRPTVRTALRLGFHQLLEMEGVPAHAAIDRTVDLVRRVGGRGAAGYANAVLQNVVRRLAAAEGRPSWEVLADLLPRRADDPAGWLAAWYSHPRWLVERWLARWGEEATERLLRHNNTPPPLSLAVLPPAVPADLVRELAAAGIVTTPGKLSPRALQVKERLNREQMTGMLAAHPDLLVQDESVLAATEFLLVDTAAPALDLCAAPGGKTLHLLRRLPAEKIYAADMARERLRLLQTAAKRIESAPPRVVCADGRRPPWRKGTFATVLLDGPCSGTGVLRRHPEGRWRLTPRLLVRNGERLYALAAAAAPLLQPGGLLLYATCSLEPEENEDVIARLCESLPWLATAPVDGKWQRRWLPWRDGADGFFAVRLRRKER